MFKKILIHLKIIDFITFLKRLLPLYSYWIKNDFTHNYLYLVRHFFYTYMVILLKFSNTIRY